MANWTPEDLDTELWLDALDASTLTVLADGSISEWRDKSGKERHAIQTTTSRRPKWENWGDLKTVSFVNDYMTVPGTASSLSFMHYTGGEIYAVCEFESAATICYLAGTSGNANSRRGFFVAMDDRKTITESNFALGGCIMNGNSSFSGYPAAHFDPNASNKTRPLYNRMNLAPYDYPQLCRFKLDPMASPSSRLMVATYGQPAIGDNVLTAAPTQGNSTYDLDIGAAGGGLVGGDLRIMELIIVKDFLSADDRARLEGYLAHKWGLAQHLSEHHPYSTFPPGKEETRTVVSGIVTVGGQPARRIVRAFGYESVLHKVDGFPIDTARSLGQAWSDPVTGAYTIDLLGGYANDVFVVSFDDYGRTFAPGLSLEIGDRVHPTQPNGYVYECDASGTLPEEEPDWSIDTGTSQLIGTASVRPFPFYRPMVHGPVKPEVTDELLSVRAYNPGGWTSNTTFTLTIPTTTQEGDTLVAGIMCRNEVTPPPGWLLVSSEPVEGEVSSQRTQIYLRRAESGDAGVSEVWSQASSNQFGAHLLVIRGAADIAFSYSTNSISQTKEGDSTSNHHRYFHLPPIYRGAGQMFVGMMSVYLYPNLADGPTRAPEGFKQISPEYGSPENKARSCMFVRAPDMNDQSETLSGMVVTVPSSTGDTLYPSLIYLILKRI